MTSHKKAILQVADTGPLESLVVMLRSVGYDCYLPSTELKQVLRRIGCDTVIDIADLVDKMGYEHPFRLPEAGVADMARTDVIYVDVKAHRNGPRVTKRWPTLENKVLWYRINGGKPEHVINQRGDHGDEVNPGCPVLTPNLWYNEFITYTPQPTRGDSLPSPTACYPNNRNNYACWPPFYRFDKYGPRSMATEFRDPVCLVHNLAGWGYERLIPKMRELGVKCYGQDSPDGLVPHVQIPGVLQHALCAVHLKSSDAPGYAIYEALATGCPIVCTRRLIWRNRMESLLIPGVTCLAFDRETHDALSDRDVEACYNEVDTHLRALRDSHFNQKIGAAGRDQLKAVMWDEKRDQASLKSFLERNFS